MNWNNTAMVNLANGSWYPRGQARLLKSLDDVGFPGRRFAFQSEAEVGAPPHRERPYAFKINALKRAHEAGCNLVVCQVQCNMSGEVTCAKERHHSP